jgi:hypothetical protein
VFNLYNKQGKHLNAEEIRNALFHEQKLMRGLLVAAGDNPNVADVAPFLQPVWPDVCRIQETLKDYSVGDARYRRTKVLSWLASLLFVDSMEEGKARRLSTSRQIDVMLERVAGDGNDKLRDDRVLQDAFLLLLHALEAHAAHDVWAPGFRGSASVKWQEVPLIASTLGVGLCVVDLGHEEVEARLEARRGELLAKSATTRWRRPRKTQTSTQWAYIGDVALLLMEELQADPDNADVELRRRFGYSCIPALRAVRTDDRSI